MKRYPLQLEISGPIALWARPDTMPNPVSYVGPFRDGTAPCATENHVNPACLKTVLNRTQNGEQIR